MVDELQYWAELCPCHERLVAGSTAVSPKGPSSYRQKLRWTRLVGESFHGKCPSRGLRAPDFAAGVHLEHLENLASAHYDDISNMERDVLTAEDMSKALGRSV